MDDEIEFNIKEMVIEMKREFGSYLEVIQNLVMNRTLKRE